MYSVLNSSINKAPAIEKIIPNHIGFTAANTGLMLIKNSPIEIPPSVTWLNASAIRDNLLTTIKAPIKGAISPTRIPLINEYLIKSKFIKASIIHSTTFRAHMIVYAVHT
ncbi:hypothetical protein HB162lentus_02500 [Mammaliicoccus lentus]